MFPVVATVSAAGLVARVALGIYLHDWLSERLEFSTGRTSRSQLWEEISWPTQNPLHNPNPLLRWLMVNNLASNAWWFILVDFCVALVLYHLLAYYYSAAQTQRKAVEDDLLTQWEERGRPRLLTDGEVEEIKEDEEEAEEWSACMKQQVPPSPTLARDIALAYWCCPVVWFACGAQSFAAFAFLLSLIALHASQLNLPTLAGVAFAALVFLQGPALAFLLCVPLYRLNKHANRFLPALALGFATLVLLCHDFPKLDWEVRDLRPNVGMWWYLQTEVFDQYRYYFLLLLHAFPILVGSITNSFLATRPLLQYCFAMAVWQTFQPYPELFHVFTTVLLLSAHGEFLNTTVSKYTLWPCVLILSAVSCLLQPLMLHLWLDNMGGNANFYYFQCLLANGMLSILMLQFYLSVITRDTVMRRIQKFLKQ